LSILTFQTKKENSFGKNIIYSEIFAKLETLEIIKNIQKLSFEHFGVGAKKNERGDIVVFADSLTYIKNIDIEFV